MPSSSNPSSAHQQSQAVSPSTTRVFKASKGARSALTPISDKPPEGYAPKVDQGASGSTYPCPASRLRTCARWTDCAFKTRELLYVETAAAFCSPSKPSSPSGLECCSVPTFDATPLITSMTYKLVPNASFHPLLGQQVEFPMRVQVSTAIDTDPLLCNTSNAFPRLRCKVVGPECYAVPKLDAAHCVLRPFKHMLKLQRRNLYHSKHAVPASSSCSSESLTWAEEPSPHLLNATRRSDHDLAGDLNESDAACQPLPRSDDNGVGISDVVQNRSAAERPVRVL
ncbi:hypothetical protein BDV98DRAFT_597166 [Pterulicium gracile]|uniref:Uncharacterized protein n=1 Tax=Pterulicium gracile TaxID=1884261 RepID=A0A5C3Q9R6_9AGAR|nr:hypothetical protein BDV98DRAFT_597166 [Pterula gracilis]